MPAIRLMAVPYRRFLLFLAAVASGFALFGISAALRSADEGGTTPRLQIHQGDHICLVGNTLADRMQHDGWLETYLYSRLPKNDLVVRDLGFSGDELTLRLRSAGFGSPDEHLTTQKADVIFAFFGYNESFAGPEGLEKFKRDVTEFIKHTLGQRYNGHSAPRLVLFSPIGHENLHDRNLPDGSENNRRLALYTSAMADVAKSNGVPFVDLYHPTLSLYSAAAHPLTIDGVHLTEDGDKQLAQVIDAALFADQPAPKRDPAAIEKAATGDRRQGPDLVQPLSNR